MTVTVDSAHALEDAVREVEEHGQQVIVERDGEPVAVLVSPGFLKVFREFAEELEDRLDLEAYYEAKRDAAELGEKPIPYETFRKELGL